MRYPELPKEKNLQARGSPAAQEGAHFGISGSKITPVNPQSEAERFLWPFGGGAGIRHVERGEEEGLSAALILLGVPQGPHVPST